MQVLRSFADLAKVMGCKVKAEKIVNEASFINIEERCGRKAAIIWAFLQDQEACKRYGPAGAILHDSKSLQEATGFEEATVFGSVIALCRNGYAKLATNGLQVRAA